MAPKSIISPDVDTPRGLPPRNALIAGFIVISLLGLAFWWVSTPTTEGKAVSTAVAEAARNPDNYSGDVRGSAASVDEAARNAKDVVEAEERKRRSDPVSSSSAATVTAPQRVAGDSVPEKSQSGGRMPLPPGALPNLSGPAAPSDGRGTRPGQPNSDEADAAATAREVDSRSAGFMVHDGRKGPESVDQAVELVRATGDSAGGSAGLSNYERAAKQAADAAKAAPRAANSRGEKDAMWLRDFASESRSGVVRPRAAAGRWMVSQGLVIPAVTTREIVSDKPGVITAVVSMDVYDGLSGTEVLIPKGSTVLGRYSSDVGFGDSRLLFAFSRVTLPNGMTIDLAGAPGADRSGAAGVSGDVNNHYVRLFGYSLLIGLIADKVTRPASTSLTTQPQLSASGQILADTSKEILEKGRVVPTTITVPRGTRINVEVATDIVFDGPYRLMANEAKKS